jgi:hypothetical protein
MGLLKSNSKLRPDGIWSFGITPGASCPMAGACSTFCYAQKGCYRIFAKTVVPKLNRDFKSTKKKNFADTMIAEIKKKRHLRYVRIHSEGDFYDQEYLDKWVKIAKACPDVVFYCYTKSLHLDWTSFMRLPNTKRIQSVGGRLDSEIDLSLPHAIIFKSSDSLKKCGYVDCSQSDLSAIGPVVHIGLIAH